MKVINILKKNKAIFSEEDIDFIYRLGRKGINNRPIKIGLISFRKKIDIIKNRKLLKGTQIYIEEEITREEMAIKKRLIPIMKQKREEGKRAYIRKGKLVVDGIVINEIGAGASYDSNCTSDGKLNSFSRDQDRDLSIQRDLNTKKRTLSEEEFTAVSRTPQKRREENRENKNEKGKLDKNKNSTLERYFKTKTNVVDLQQTDRNEKIRRKKNATLEINSS